MARRKLAEDHEGPPGDPFAPSRRLDDDAGSWFWLDTTPIVNLKARSRAGVDGNGDAVFVWATVAASLPVIAVQGQHPERPGVDREVWKLTALYEGPELDSDIMVDVDWGDSSDPDERALYRVTEMSQNQLRLELTLERG